MNHRRVPIALVLLLSSGGRLSAAESAPTAFPTFGLEVTTPSGWERVPEVYHSQVARWGDTRQGRPTVFVWISAGVAGDRPLKEEVEAAADPGSTTVGSALRLFDEPTVLTTGDVTRPDGERHALRSRAARVGKAGYAIAVSGPAPLPAGASADFDAFCRGMKRVHPIDLRDALGLAGRSVSLLGSQFVMDVPESMRPLAPKPLTAEQEIAITDHLNRRANFAVGVLARPKPATWTGERVARTLGEELARQLRRAEPVLFARVRQDPDVWVSLVFPMDAGKLDGIAAFVITPAPDRFIFLNISYGTDADERRTAAYPELVQAMARSIRVRDRARRRRTGKGRSGARLSKMLPTPSMKRQRFEKG